MKRGTKPKPTEQKILDGNPGKRPLNEQEPTPPPFEGDALAVPDELIDNPRAVTEWLRCAPLVQRARIVTVVDRSALIAVCLEWSRYIDATKKVAALGMVIKTPSGYPIVNPYLSIATKALAGCARLWPELGMTPSGRTGVKVDGPPEGDAFAEFDTPPTQH